MNVTITIDVENEKRPLDELVERTLEGVEIVLTKGNRPVARLVPIQTKPHRLFGSAKGLITIAKDFDAPLEDFQELTS
jgi:antitoxin (DNA-binding transcriptional repressor) of toxin-antitoxin stability system